LWENVSHDGDDETPLTFATEGEAMTELADHLATMRIEGMDFNPDEYRVAPVKP
jgi:hypothetical protein